MERTQISFPFILHKSTFLDFVRHGIIFYAKYINTDDRKKYIVDDGNVIFPKHKERKLYNTKYQETNGNRRYVLLVPYI